MILLLLACGGYQPVATPQPDPDGLRLAWGDLHAHSGWSFDGCEAPQVDCTHAQALPAEAFFAAADEAGLDFVALTDHAEADWYAWGPDPLHATGGEAEVWAGQQAAVLAAEARGGALPVLGYEWTSITGEDHPGTHRTVLLEDPAACAAWRLAGRALPAEGWVPDVGDRLFLHEDTVVETLPAGLWAALDAAGEAPGCAPTRWLSFAHHSAYANPQETDWEDPDNAPLAEGLVELYSEHGSSECADLAAPGCAWMVNLDQSWTAAGAVQAALDQGYALGFVAGTDSHDARPGSLLDGPGPIAHWQDGAPQRQLAPGGLTGALVELPADQPLDRAALFDALLARRTVATSGPRPALAAWAEGRSGARYNPGALLPRDELPATLHLALGPLDPRGTLAEGQAPPPAIELVGPGGVLLASTTGEEWSGEWTAEGGDWAYLRVRWERAAGEGLAEERVWVSPWFAEAGCAAAPVAGAPWLALVAVLRRRRRPGVR